MDTPRGGSPPSAWSSARFELLDPALEHAEDLGAFGVRLLVVHQEAQLIGVQRAEPGPDRGQRERVVAGQRQIGFGLGLGGGRLGRLGLGGGRVGGGLAQLSRGLG
jgi:hypothetical protein